jgi:cytochrome c556
MKRLVCLTGFLICLAVVVMVDAANKTPTIKEIMNKLNKGTDCTMQFLRKELRTEEPNWDAVQEQTRKFAELAEALGKKDPPRGEKDSWEKLTKAYAEHAKALDEAAKSKDKTAAKAAHAKLAGSCKACHDAHKPKMTSGL